jgi:catechol 2,3-dioxygenase-like lactoylglutathione lyase family enzyme
MRLAKPFLDVALFTARPHELVAFWREEVGAEFDHTLPISKGHDQYRMNLSGSVVKINAVDHLADRAASGFREVLVARDDIAQPLLLKDPDGNRVRLVPRGYCGIRQIGVQVNVRSLEAHIRFMREALELDSCGLAKFTVGESTLLLVEDVEAISDVQLLGPGWRYLTIQIFDAVHEHERFLAAGGFPGTPVQRLGDVAIFAMVRDPDGNWIELSQRASLTGSLD